MGWMKGCKCWRDFLCGLELAEAFHFSCIITGVLGDEVRSRMHSEPILCQPILKARLPTYLKDRASSSQSARGIKGKGGGIVCMADGVLIGALSSSTNASQCNISLFQVWCGQGWAWRCSSHRRASSQWCTASRSGYTGRMMNKVGECQECLLVGTCHLLNWIRESFLVHKINIGKN